MKTSYKISYNELKQYLIESINEDAAADPITDEVKNTINGKIDELTKDKLTPEQAAVVKDDAIKLLKNPELLKKVSVYAFKMASPEYKMLKANWQAFKRLKNGDKVMDIVKGYLNDAFVGEEFERKIKMELLKDPKVLVDIARIIFTKGADKEAIASVCVKFTDVAIKVADNETKNADNNSANSTATV